MISVCVLGCHVVRPTDLVHLTHFPCRLATSRCGCHTSPECQYCKRKLLLIHPRENAEAMKTTNVLRENEDLEDQNVSG